MKKLLLNILCITTLSSMSLYSMKEIIPAILDPLTPTLLFSKDKSLSTKLKAFGKKPSSESTHDLLNYMISTSLLIPYDQRLDTFKKRCAEDRAKDSDEVKSLLTAIRALGAMDKAEAQKIVALFSDLDNQDKASTMMIKLGMAPHHLQSFKENLTVKIMYCEALAQTTNIDAEKEGTLEFIEILKSVITTIEQSQYKLSYLGRFMALAWWKKAAGIGLIGAAAYGIYALYTSSQQNNPTNINSLDSDSH